VAQIGRLSPGVDLGALRQAVQDLVQRHAVLGAACPVADGEPRLELRREASVDLAEHSACSPGQDEFEEWVAHRVCESFDLASGPLVRFDLFSSPGARLEAPVRQLLVTLHAVAADAASLPLLTDDLGALYGAAVAGVRPPLPPVRVEYGEVARAERDRVSGAEGERLWRFWKSRLADDFPDLVLPADRPRPADPAGRVARHDVELPGALGRGVRQLARRLSIEPSDLMLAAFQILLARYGGQSDVALWLPTRGLRDGSYQGVVGPLANTVLLRTHIDSEESFARFSTRARSDVAETLNGRGYPFSLAVARLNPIRHPNRPPLATVLFDWIGPSATQHTSSVARPHRPSALFRDPPRIICWGQGPADLALRIEERAGAFSSCWNHAAELFDASSIATMARRFEALLHAALEAPDTRVGDLPVHAEEDVARVLASGRGPASPLADDRSVHEQIAERASRQPRRIAMTFRGKCLTYGELDRRASRVARHLRALGAGPDVVVGIRIDRGLDMIVGLLGILKAGGAYLPVDPDLPPDRSRQMLSDAGVRILLTGAGLVPLDASSPVISVHLADDEEELDACADDPRRLHRGENLAYVIYTSGSTGIPKGVLVEHRSIANLIEQTNRICVVDEDARVLQFASICFDVSGWEILKTLVAGATLCIAADEERLPGGGLESLLLRERISHAGFVPFLLAMIDPTGMSSLRHVFVGFEPCPMEVYRAWSAGRSFYNAYGPTEATIACTVKECGPEEAAPLSIGRAIGNASAHVVDGELRLVPAGVPGELVIGGIGVARGYLNRPELTAEKFPASPFPGDRGARLYRTGDLVRQRKDGDLEFLGRIDHQLKIRGYRIELGEIEAALTALAPVADAAVVANEGEAGVKRLVAFVVLRPGGPANPQSLRRDLGARLPDYMIPAAFESVDALPRTPNGKVDRSTLQAAASRRDRAAKVRPRSPLERLVASLFEEILCIGEEIGIDDGFFELGGNSLLAAQLVHRLGAVLAADFPVTLVFAAPTVAALSAALEARSWWGQPQDASNHRPSNDAPRTRRPGRARVRSLFERASTTSS
jgi:amino acid adenylation domain-containing protein